jgi:soluble lytic murein transglycosylase-like protein
MNRARYRIVIALGAVGLAAAGAEARAAVAVLRSGQVLEVADFRLDGNRVILSMPHGGDLTLTTADVVEIRRQPSEVPPLAPSAARTAATIPEPAREATRAEQAPESVPAGPAAADAPAAAVEIPPPVAPSATTGASPLAPHTDEGEPPLLPVGGAFDQDALRTMAARIARRYGVAETLVQAVIEVESRYDPFAVSPRGAMGLMQLMPKTASRFAVANVFDPVQNVDGGVRYLKELLGRYSGQVRLALAAYNAGEDAVERYSGIPPYRETIDYVRRVQRAASR